MVGRFDWENTGEQDDGSRRYTVWDHDNETISEVKERPMEEPSEGGGGGCSICLIGLIPTILLFLPFMLINNQKILFSIIDFHQHKTSPILNKLHFKCNFSTSCSKYSKNSIKKYGAMKGGMKTFRRLLRCNSSNKNKKH